MFKMVFLPFLYDLSAREIEAQAAFNLVYKWFLGLSAEELPPDHPTRCRFRARLGAEGLEMLVNQGVGRARDRGFITDRLHLIDSPEIAARFGRKTKKKGFYGYKAHKVEDADSEFIVKVKTPPRQRA